MRILLCMKGVSTISGGAGRDGGELIVNPADMAALEEALALRDKRGGTVTVVSMGPAACEGLLRSALAMGADRAALISDSAFAGADTAATSRTLAAAVEYLGGFDMIFCGRKSTDGETGQVGVELAVRLKLPCCTGCTALETDGESAVCSRITDEGSECVSLSLPAVFTFKNGINSPRLPSLMGLAFAKSAAVELITNGELRIPPERCGEAGSPTSVRSSFRRPFEKRQAERISGVDAARIAGFLRDSLSEGGGTHG